MKKFFSFIIASVMCLSLTSCVVAAEAQTDGIYVTTDGVDVDVIITYGTPYYNAEGLLLYYIYRDLYYYPYYHGSRWYFRSYSRPVHHYRPVPRDFYRHRPVVHRNDNRRVGNVVNRPPSVRGGGVGQRPNVDRMPNGPINRPNVDRRPNQQMRSSTRVSPQPSSGMSRGGGSRPSGNGHFGGSRR